MVTMFRTRYYLFSNKPDMRLVIIKMLQDWSGEYKVVGSSAI